MFIAIIQLVWHFNTVANKYVPVNIRNFVGNCNVLRAWKTRFVYVRMYTIYLCKLRICIT